MIIRRYNEFFNFSKKEKVAPKPTFKSKIDECVYDIFEFLKENDIKTWNHFTTNKFDRYVIDKLIDSYGLNMDDVNEVKFQLKLKLGNKSDLKELLDECEENEEYEKCARIKQKMDQLS